MNNSTKLALRRREFLASVPCLILSERFLLRSSDSHAGSLIQQELPEELSPKEAEWVQNSSMAKELLDYFGKGYSCAESLFMVSLKFLKKPEDLVWAAAGFGGGLYHRDLCGFLTGGIMAIGISSGMLKKEREEAKEFSKKGVNQYWEWWTSLAPLHCSEIREERKSSQACVRLGQLAAAKTEDLITPVKSSG